jgi:hypothetical protein
MPFEQSDFDPSFAAPAQWAEMYRSFGIQVVPARKYDPRHPERPWKMPAIKEWGQFQEELIPDSLFTRWYGPQGEWRSWQNMGVITGRASDNLLCVDLDTHSKPEAGLWWQGQLVINNYGRELETWRQRTGGGGRQLFFHLPPGVIAPTNKTPIGVDLRGQGGFAMLPPSLHSSGLEYQWELGASPWECGSPALAPDWLIDAVYELVATHGGHSPASGLDGREATPSPPSDFDGFWRRVDGRESDMARRVWAGVMALRREVGNSDGWPECEKRYFEEALTRYLRDTRTRLPDVDNIEGLEREGRGPSAFYAKWQRAMRKWGTDRFEAEAAKPNPRTENKSLIISGQAQSPHPEQSGHPFEQSRHLIPITPAFPIDAKAIGRRKWLIKGVMLRGHMSLLVAPAGSGKSLLTLQLAIALAAGMSWGGFPIKKPYRVLVINAEDDVEEMRRRLWAAATTMGVTQEDIADRLFLAERPETIVIAKSEGRRVTVTPLADQLKATIKEHEIDAVFVDPFAETFEGDENSNSEVKWAGIAWREIARATECGLKLVHHTRKYANDMAGDADASRGGGALIGTARVVSTLFHMREEEAKLMDIDPEERSQFVRYDDAKANLSLVTKIARWFKKETVKLPNGTLSEEGDEVGVLVPWKPPGLLEGVTVATLNTVLDVIDRGVIDPDTGRPTGEFFTPYDNTSNKGRWVGTPICNMLKCDPTKAKSIVNAWLKSELLIKSTYHDGKQERACVKVDNAKRPGMETS